MDRFSHAAYRFEAFHLAGHDLGAAAWQLPWLPEQVPDKVAALLTEQFAAL